MTIARVDLSGWPFGLAAGMLAIAVGLLAGVQPQLAIAASFGLAFLIIVLTDLVAGLMVFTFLAFLEIVPFGGPALSFSKLLGGLLFLSWLLVMTGRRDIAAGAGIIRTLSVLLGGFLAWTALSVMWAEVPSEAIAAVFRYALNAAFFVIVATALREPPRRSAADRRLHRRRRDRGPLRDRQPRPVRGRVRAHRERRPGPERARRGARAGGRAVHVLCDRAAQRSDASCSPSPSARSAG